MLERERPAVEQVLQPPRRGDEDVRAPGKLGLARESRPAVDGGHGESAGMRDVVKLVDDLGGELAGRREDERRRTPLRVGEPVDDRQAEGERLARAGRRLDEHVAPMQHVGYDETLDWEGLGDAPAGECVDNRSGHAEIGEG